MGESKILLAENIASTKTFQIETPDVIVKVKSESEQSDLVEIREVDGREGLVIAIKDDLKVNAFLRSKI